MRRGSYTVTSHVSGSRLTLVLAAKAPVPAEGRHRDTPIFVPLLSTLMLRAVRIACLFGLHARTHLEQQKVR